MQAEVVEGDTHGAGITYEQMQVFYFYQINVFLRGFFISYRVLFPITCSISWNINYVG